MGVYISGVSKRTTMVDGKKAAFTRFWGKAPGWSPSGHTLRAWNTFLTKSDNAMETLEAQGDVVYLIYGNKLKEGATVAWYRRAATVDDGYWDKWTVGTLHKVGRSWTVKPSEYKTGHLTEHQFKQLTHWPYVTDVAMVSYRGYDNRYVFTPRSDIGMSEHSLDADVTDLNRLNAHFAGFREVASTKV